MLGWNAKAVELWFKKCPTSAFKCKDHLTATTMRIREPYYHFDGCWDEGAGRRSHPAIRLTLSPFFPQCTIPQ